MYLLHFGIKNINYIQIIKKKNKIILNISAPEHVTDKIQKPAYRAENN